MSPPAGSGRYDQGREEGRTMWDTVQTSTVHLSHDLPCPRCGHAVHTFLECGDGCDCRPVQLPGSHAA